MGALFWTWREGETGEKGLCLVGYGLNPEMGLSPFQSTNCYEYLPTSLRRGDPPLTKGLVLPQPTVTSVVPVLSGLQKSFAGWMLPVQGTAGMRKMAMS